MKTGFIGLGNMAKAMIGGMLESGVVKGSDIIGSAKTERTLSEVKTKYGIETTADNKKVASQAEILFLAVKPQFFSEVITEIKNEIREDAIIVSIAVGKTMADIEALFGKEIRLVRCMPNVPILAGAGCSGVCRNKNMSEGEMAACMKLISSFGVAEEVTENLMDAVAGVSGSSPAYVFLFLEALADGAVAAGLSRKQAYIFAAQAVMGSAKLMLETGLHPGVLKDMVCSPAGTSIEGVRLLEERGLRGAVMDAVKITVDKARMM